MTQSEPPASASPDLPFSGTWHRFCVLDDVMPYCVHDSAGPVLIPPD